ncbi:MAG: DUF4238 domain-containing protein [Verrucomicrobiae bacterium]|nr:DUF4238 domain-containing protein [Verrucomicrobiae bacterium]
MTPKSHHYNPKVYLRQFVSPAAKNELWEFDLREGTARLASPKACGCEDYYHSFDTAEGVRDDDSVEKSFVNIENNLPKLFKLIRRQLPIPNDSWGILFLFAALQRARCPRALNSMQSGLSQMYAYTFDIMKQTSAFAADIEKMGLDLEAVRKTKFDITADRGVTMLMLLSVFADGKLASLFARMQWSFLVAPPGLYFWTSDDPVCCWADREPDNIFSTMVGPANADVEITFPLSKRVCAFAAWKSPAKQLYSIATAEQVKVINDRNIYNGWRFAYGPTNAAEICTLVQNIAKRRQERAQVKQNT